MIEQLAERKKVELELKVATLESELQGWFNRSEAGGRFEKHHTQIRALQAHLKGWHASIRKLLEKYKAEAPDLFLGHSGNAENLILSEHRIWDYFRSKFIQREEECFLPYLRAADEFAWACYQPVQQAVYPKPDDAKRKEPPLVFFNGGASPFSVSRGKSFQPEPVAGEPLSIDAEDYMTRLPIPVVGVPWDQISHLPAVLVIGHEVGHIVEDDFGLGNGLKEILNAALAEANADQSRVAAWNSWLGEIFADLYGCLAGGPAFAGTLIDFLAKAKLDICNEQRLEPQWGKYPTDVLRVRVVLRALEVMKFDKEIDEYRNLWANYSSSMPAAFDEDLKIIVPRLLETAQDALGKKSIKDVLCFTEDHQKKVRKITDEFSANKPPFDTAFNIPSTDIREIFAALRRAFEIDAVKYVESRYGNTVLEHIQEKVVKKGVRGREGEVVLEGKKLQTKLSSYEQTGAELLEAILAGLKVQ
jgi:hypothetical protein